MGLKWVVNLLILFCLPTFLQAKVEKENNRKTIVCLKSNKGVIPDSIYVKFDLNSNFKLDIAAIKLNQIYVRPDTNYKAYHFDNFSDLLYFSLPTVVMYPISAGDSIFVSSKSDMPYIKVINNNKYSEREVNFVTELSRKNINIFEYSFKENGIPENVLRATLDYVDSVAITSRLSKDYINWLKKNAQFSYLALTQNKDIVTSPIDVNEKNNIDSNLYYRYYQAFLWSRMDSLLNEDYSSIIHIIDVAESNFTKMCRDYVLYKFAIEHLRKIPAEQAKLSISKLEHHFMDTEFLFLLKNQYLPEFNVEVTYTDQLLQANGETISFEQMISKYKGKKIYLDVWASWCTPCRAEMPSSHSLKREIEGHEIAIVYLSIDKRQNDWLKANKEEALGDNDSYLILNPLKATFLMKYNVNAIPRYFIIDENGNVVNENAPRPGSIEIKEILNIM